MELHIYKDNDELSIAVAEWMVDYIAATLKKQDRFTTCFVRRQHAA